jgi:zinc/manganese transport system ATP-binding protein
MKRAAITLQGVTLAYGRHRAVAGITGRFDAGSLTALVGPNGAGKSTLLKAIAGTMRPAAGTIDRGGLAPHHLGYLPQAAEIDRSFPVTVADTVMLGAWRHTGAFRGIDAATADRARAALAAVGLDHHRNRTLNTLSAGQFQRVLFARLLLQDAPVILLDEPFTAIDARTTHDLLAIMRDWHAQGRTVITVLHDFDQVRAHFPSALLLARQQIAWGKTDAALSTDNFRRARAIAEAWEEPPQARQAA